MMEPGAINEALAPPRTSEREEWARYYLTEPPATIFESDDERAAYFQTRRELQDEVAMWGYVRAVAA